MKKPDHQQKSTNLHRHNYIDSLRIKIIEEAEEKELMFYAAATRVLLSWLGFQIDSGDLTFIDCKDSGIDACYIADAGIELFQVKTHDLTSEELLCLDPFDNTGVNDLIRAKNLLCFYENSNVVSRDIKNLLSHWSYMLKQRKAQEVEIPMLVTLNLIVLGENLSPQAQEEFTRFQKSIEGIINIDGVAVQFDAVLYTIDSIIKTRWQEDNREWKDSLGNKKTSIKLSPLKEGEWINDNKNAIFYCSALHLVNEYEALGYQLFEPNVRAEIKRSRVNEAIRESVRHDRTRKDFRFLNNGVTITCESFDLPKKGGRKEFIVRHPGVVNGLQTVVALHTAYYELSGQDKIDFEKNCSVLVRLLRKHAVNDIADVVRATNTQNPMRPRNLVSNNIEQIEFARIFAYQLGWFYAAKEGAWNAFEKDHKRWRPSLNKTVKEFKTKKNKTRKVDNHELAQTWLSFIGCSYTAAEERDQLFVGHYELIFKRRTNKHGYDFGYSPSVAKLDNHSEFGAPNAYLMLVSYLSYSFAQSMVPGKKENRKQTCERLGKEINKLLEVDDYHKLNKLELDGKLFETDENFALNHVLRYMPFLFTDFVGFILFYTFGKNIHNHGQEILSNHSFNVMRHELDIESIRQKIETEKFETNDLLVILWLIFLDKMEDWMLSDWKQSYRNADRKTRFVLSKETRNRLFKEIMGLNGYMQKKQPEKSWAIGVKTNQGLFEFIKKCVFEKNPKPPKELKLF